MWYKWSHTPSYITKLTRVNQKFPIENITIGIIVPEEYVTNIYNYKIKITHIL